MSQQRRVFVAVLITSFIGPFMGSSINLAIPAMAEEFGVPAASLSWVISTYLMGSVAVLLPMGRLGDLLGWRRLYTWGTFCLMLCTIAAGFSSSSTVLMLWRFMQGMSAAAIFGTGMAMIVSIHKPQERGKVIGYSSASTYIGLSMGPVLGGFITHYCGWQWIFFITGGTLAVGLWLITKVEQEWRSAADERFDWMGAAAYMTASPAILYGVSRLADLPEARYILLGGLMMLALFLHHQTRVEMPIFDVRLFRSNTVFAMSNIAAMINYSATFAIGFVLSLYLQLIRGMDAVSAGMILLLQPVIMAIGSPQAGALSDRVRPQIVASVGLALNAAGLGAFYFLSADTPLVLIGLNFMLIGLGFALFSSPNNNAIMGAVEAKQYGVASSMLAVMRMVGQAMSMAIVTLVLASFAPEHLSSGSPLSLLAGFRVSFGIFAVLCAAGIAASLARGKR